MTRRALPGRPGEAYCPRCGRSGIRTEVRGHKEEYVGHGHVEGGVDCHNSGQPVDPPPRRP